MPKIVDEKEGDPAGNQTAPLARAGNFDSGNKTSGKMLTSLTLASLCVFVIVFFAPVTTSGRLLGGFDTEAFHVPAFFAPWGLWCNALACGLPTASDPQWESFYPLALLFGLTRDFNAFVVAAYCLSICFTYLFLFDLTRSRIGAAIGAMSFSLGGFSIAHMGHTAIAQSTLWLPLLMLATRRFLNGASWRWFFVAQVAIACSLFAGHTQVLFLTLILASTYTVFQMFENRSRIRRGLILLLLGVPSGLALAAVQIIPAIQLMHQSVRSQMSFEEFVSYALDSSQLTAFVFPLLYGGGGGLLHGNAYFGPWNLAEMGCYIGVTPLILAIAKLFDANSRGRWFWLGVIGFSILFASGFKPVHTILFHIPIFNLFRCPARYLLLADFSLSVLAAGGFAFLEVLSKRKAARRAIINSALITLLLASSLFVMALPNVQRMLSVATAVHVPFEAHILTQLLMFAGLFLVGSGLLWLLNGHSESKLLRAVILVFCAVDSTIVGFECSILRGLRSFEGDGYVQKSAMLQPESMRSLSVELARDKFRFVDPLGGEDQNVLLGPNAYLLWNLPGITSFGPLLLKSRVEFFGCDGLGNTVLALDPNSASLDLVGAKYIVVSKRGLANSANGVSARLSDSRRFQRRHDPLPGYEMYENNRALCRFRFSKKVSVTPPPSIIAAVQSSILPNGTRFDPREVDLIEQEVQTDIPKMGSHAAYTIIADDNGRIVLETDCTEKRMLVVADQYYPGWRCTVDGVHTDILRTDYILRGVVVPSGRHLMEMIYRPRSFILGAAISCFIIGLDLLIVFGLIANSLKWRLWFRERPARMSG